MTPNPEHVKRILCLHCTHNLKLDEEWRDDGDSAALVRCGSDGYYRHLRTKCPWYKAKADCLKQPEPCNGDCEHCANRDEWKEWAE